ncbi:FadR/GntR family transcriptional regulator [Nocardiopsis oceani]
MNEQDDLAINPIARTKAHEEVARQLRDLMQREVLRSGERLPPERDLAKRFHVSRATIRQALSLLQSQGLVESHVGAGTFVRAKISSVTELATALSLVNAPLNDQFELRRLIEPQLAQTAAIQAEEHDLDELRRHMSDQERCIAEGTSFVNADSAFHLAIAQTTKNALLAKMVEGINELLLDSRNYSLRTSGGIQVSFEGHQRILTAIEHHDPEIAHEAMTSHILDVERLSLQALCE